MGHGSRAKTQESYTLSGKKRCFINIKNDDDKCFAYSIAAYLLQREAIFLKQDKWAHAIAAKTRDEDVPEPEELSTEELEMRKVEFEIPNDPALPNPFLKVVEHPNRPNYYKRHFERFDLNNIQYPVSPKEVDALQDQLHLKINIFSYFDEDGCARYPLFISGPTLVLE